MTRRLLVCTDLDRTLIPNGHEAESAEARPRFRALAARPEVSLVYVTGRDRRLVGRAISDYGLPTPDKVLADVGTTIYDVGDHGRWRVDGRWHEEISRDWAAGATEAMKKLFHDMQGMRLQDAARQGSCKLSYYVNLDCDTQALCDDVKSRLSGKRIPASVVYSVDEPNRIGLLDILPERASKLHAIRFIMRELRFDSSDTVFSGDSGNDLDVLASEIPGVLVANASERVRMLAITQAGQAGYADALYVAAGGFLGMNGHYAAGILEGLAHYHPVVCEWLAGATVTDATR